MSILDEGLKYNFPHLNKNPLFIEVINADCAIKAIPDNDNRNAVRYAISNKLNNKPSVSMSAVHKQECP